MGLGMRAQSSGKPAGPRGGAGARCNTKTCVADFKAREWGFEPEPRLGFTELFYWAFYCLLLKALIPLVLTPSWR